MHIIKFARGISLSIKQCFNEPNTKIPSERSFGLFFVVVFSLASGYAHYKSLPLELSTIFFLVSIIFLVLVIFCPKLLGPLNRAWFALGIFLGKIASPLVLGLIFFLIITPYAVVMRLAGRDALKLHKQKVESYWIDRNPIGPHPNSFKNQF
jgi:hypothetical protein